MTESQDNKWIRLLTIVGVGAVLTTLSSLMFLPEDTEPPPRIPANLSEQFHSIPVESFDYSNLSIPSREIENGGPSKDGIPSIDSPTFRDAGKVDFLRSEDRVVGVVIAGQARAYPLRILTYHEVVNDTLADQPIAVTFCPLCDSVLVFDRIIDGSPMELGVSGMLFNSNVLMYVRGESENLVSQMYGQHVSGRRAKKPMNTVPCELTRWDDWKQRWPATEVLEPPTNSDRIYSRDPYRGYLEIDNVMFPVRPFDRRMPPKSKVLGLWDGEQAKAYPLQVFSESMEIEDKVGEHAVRIAFDSKSASLRVMEAATEVQIAYSLWFAWAAFHPETEIYEPPDRTP